MTVRVHQNWPVMVINPPRVKAIQKETMPRTPLQNLWERIRLNNQDKPKSDLFFEKGLFIDIYA